MIVKGFAGFQLDGKTVRFKPALPVTWQGATFHLVVHGNRVHVQMAATD